MNIIKDSTVGILFSPFAVGGIWHLQAAVLHYFALDDANAALPETELWEQGQKELGTSVLDPGFPKACGEVLVAGSWFAPNASVARGGVVRIQAGPIHRELAVFGPRYWQGGPLAAISKPESAASVPLTWESAFGGPEFAENRQGMGTAPVDTPWGEKRLPLPLVEDPKAGLITSPNDSPKPACPLPVPGDVPSRLAMSGTYDARWLKEFWPGFPADVNPDFFSLAQRDQRLPKTYAGDAELKRPGYFAGGEKFCLENMHPTKRLLTGSLPTKRVRVFASRTAAKGQTGYPFKEKAKDAAELKFEEISAHLETVWFFPTIERGVALYRAVMPCADDEYSDIVSLFPVVEDADAPRTDISCWLEEQKKRTAKPAPPAPVLPPEAAEAMNTVKASVRTLEEDAHLSVDKAMGLAPSLPPNAQAVLDSSRQKLQKTLADIEQREKEVRELRKSLGSTASIPVLDPALFTSLKDSVQQMLERLNRTEKQIDYAGKFVETAKKTAAEQAQEANELFAAMPPTEVDDKIAKVKAEADKLLEDEKSWSKTILRLLSDAPLATGTSPAAQEACEALAACGLRTNDVQNALFGFLPEKRTIPLEDLCLAPEAAKALKAENGLVLLPQGLLVPWFSDSTCVALHVRQGIEALAKTEGDAGSDAQSDALDDFFAGKDAFVVPGSGAGCQLIGFNRTKPLLLTDDPLTAWLLYSQAGDLFAILLLTGKDAELSPRAAKAAQESPCILWPVPPLDEKGFADGLAPEGPAMPAQMRRERITALCKKWTGLAASPAGQKIIPTAWPWSSKHLGRAAFEKQDIRGWLIQELQKLEIPVKKEKGSVELKTNEEGETKLALTLPTVDVKGIQDRLHSRISALCEEKTAELKADLQKAFAKYNEIRQAKGLGIKELPKLSMDEILHSPMPSEPDEEVLKQLDMLADEMGKMNGPQDKAKVLNLKEKYIADLKKISDLDKKGKEALIAQQKSLAAGNAFSGPVPDWVKDVPGAEAALQQASGNPQAPQLPDLKKGTKGLTIKKADFSHQDLTGVRFENCFLEDVDFSYAILDESCWEKVMATRVNFTGTSLASASFAQCSFDDCQFVEAKAPKSTSELCSWQNGTIKDCSLAGACMKLASLDSVLCQGTLEGMSIELTTLEKCTLANLAFKDCRLRKTTFSTSKVSGLSFIGGKIEETGFVTCKGSGLSLLDVKSTNMRFLLRCELDDIRMSRCALTKLCLRESSLLRLAAKKCSMDDAIADFCDLPGAGLAGCRAPRARFLHCDLEGANLSYLRLPQGSLRRSRLVKANMESADLYGADLYKAVLGETNMHGANLTGTLLQGTEKTMHKLELSL